jgi:hypothetical protein
MRFQHVLKLQHWKLLQYLYFNVVFHLNWTRSIFKLTSMRDTCWNWRNVELKWHAEFDMFNVEIHFNIEKHVELISTWILAEIWRHNFGRRGEGTNSTRLITPTRDCYMHVFLVKYKTLVTSKTVNSLRVFIFDISDKIWSSEMNEINAYKWQNMRSTIIRLLVKYRSSLEALVPLLVKVKVKFQYPYRRRFFNSNKPG